MKNPHDATPSSESSRKISVPRDPDAGREPRDDSPPAGSVQNNEADSQLVGKSLLPETKTARALHDDPPKGEDQLDPGTGGDAGRAGKEGIANTSIPPRQH